MALINMDEQKEAKKQKLLDFTMAYKPEFNIFFDDINLKYVHTNDMNTMFIN